MKLRKKLIEVALPLDAINAASAREKSIRHGHPSTLHLWWARRPLAAARAVIFSQMVDDPSEYVEELLDDASTKRAAEKAYQTQLKAWEVRKATFEKGQAAGMTESANPDPGVQPTLEGVVAQLERERLFALIEQLVLWENTTNEKVLQAARDELWRSWRRTCADNADHPQADELFNPEQLPAFHDPFAGGGALPLEAQRLGLESYASDLNPVAVLINKAMIEIPPKFAGMPPVNPRSREELRLMPREWKGAEGLADDVLYYGQWMRDEAEKRIGYLYPKVEITPEMAEDRPDLKKYVGRKLTVIAWLWARTVKSPNPAYANIDVPLLSTYLLSNKDGKQAYIEPIIYENGYHFVVKIGKPDNLDYVKNGTKLKRANFICLLSGVPISGEYIKREGKAARIGTRMTAIVAEGDRERVFLSPTDEMERIVNLAKPEWKPDGMLVEDARAFTPILYGMLNWSDLFTARQLVALTTLSDLIDEARRNVLSDAIDSDFSDDNVRLENDGVGALSYADSIAIYLAFAIDKGANYWSSLCSWHQSRDGIVSTFGRQAVSMVWDFAEANVFSNSSGNITLGFEQAAKMIRSHGFGDIGHVFQKDAAVQSLSKEKVVSTDPPYYDNVPYADLSDFFYVWLRHSLRSVLPSIFSTLSVPKDCELVAFPYRHGGKAEAESFFLSGMTNAIHQISINSHHSYPVTIYYAFKQAESENNDGISSTGWEIFLDAVMNAGLSVSGTWPIRTEYTSHLKTARNALATSIVLVCRKRRTNVRKTTRADFVTNLKNELPVALGELQHGNIAPVDLAQAAIGPGMAVFTRYSEVLDAQGQPLSVRQALALINEVLDETLAEQEGDFDADTRWALAWFEQLGFTEGEYGIAETLSKAKDTSVEGMVEAGILTSGRGKVRLLKPAELPANWDPEKEKRLTTWEMVHHLIRVLEAKGESAAAEVVAKLGVQAEVARELCYRLYTICERKKRNTEALSYNALVQSWPEITRLAREIKPVEKQGSLF